MSDKIVVAMTSWKQRINQVADLVNAIKNQTLKPDFFYLTLSSDEFPNKEQDLPEELVSMVDEWFVINWVKDNTKSMKKVFPILEFLDDSDLIFDIDDDFINIPTDLIESRYNDYTTNGMQYAIVPDSNRLCNIPNGSPIKCCGATSVFTKKMLAHYDEFLNKSIYDIGNDDRCYTMLIALNGYSTIGSSKYDATYIFKNMLKYDKLGNAYIAHYTWGKDAASTYMMQYLKVYTSISNGNKINLYITPSHDKKCYVNYNHKNVNVINWSAMDCNFLNWVPKNHHHWTPFDACNKFLLKIDYIEGIKTDYKHTTKMIDWQMSGKTLKYFIPTKGEYKITDYNGKVVRGNASILYNTKNPMSRYHLYSGSHFITTIERLDYTEGPKVLLIADSMAIPMVMILATACSKLTYIDNREHHDLSRFNIHDYDKCFAIMVNTISPITHEPMNHWFMYDTINYFANQLD